MSRTEIEQQWIEHCQAWLNRCPEDATERITWEAAIRESRQRMDAYRLIEQDEQQVVRKPDS